jgi:hypothetical protein
MIPDSPGDMPAPVAMNPDAIGNPDETPVVFVGTDLAALLRPCAGKAPSRDGYCGGVNGFHADDCPELAS